MPDGRLELQDGMRKNRKHEYADKPKMCNYKTIKISPVDLNICRIKLYPTTHPSQEVTETLMCMGPP